MEEQPVNTQSLLQSYLDGEIDLICILGPTASGKTRYAVRLAGEIDALLAGKESPAGKESCTHGQKPDEKEGRTHGQKRSLYRMDGHELKESCTHGQKPDEKEGRTHGQNLTGKENSTPGQDLAEKESPTPRQDLAEKESPTPGQDLAGEGMLRRAEIISADSRQVYKGMTIGTGKDLGEYGSVPYHLIDIVPAGTKYNIYEYQRDFEKVYGDIRIRGCIPILCGGSGLYIESVTKGYSLPDVPADPTLRAELEKEDTDTLIRRLAALKPLHNCTDYDTRQRLIRALEIAIHEQQHPVSLGESLPKKTYYIGTSVSREERRRRIDIRLDERLSEGLVEEVKGLLDSGLNAEDLLYYGLEYKFVTLYLTGQLCYDRMRERLAIAIHQFAKRQMTWFRGMERRGTRIHWVTPYP